MESSESFGTNDLTALQPTAFNPLPLMRVDANAASTSDAEKGMMIHQNALPNLGVTSSLFPIVNKELSCEE